MEDQTIICPNCQTVNPAKNMFCQTCGKPLSPAAPRPTPPPPPIAMPAQPVPPQGYAPQGNGAPMGYAPQGMPQQQPGQMPPPAYYAQQPMPPQPVMSMPKPEARGVQLDQWDDLLEGAGAKAADVEKAFVEEVKRRNLPGVIVTRSDAGMGRSLQMVQSYAGNVATYIGSFGPDLQLSMSLYIRRKANMTNIFIMVGVAFAVSLLTSFTSLVYGNAASFLLNWIFGVFNWVLPIIVVALVYGQIFHGNLWKLFVKDPGPLAEEDARALATVAEECMEAALEKAGVEGSEE